jgi:hypothetical protein
LSKPKEKKKQESFFLHEANIIAAVIIAAKNFKTVFIFTFFY